MKRFAILAAVLLLPIPCARADNQWPEGSCDRAAYDILTNVFNCTVTSEWSSSGLNPEYFCAFLYKGVAPIKRSCQSSVSRSLASNDDVGWYRSMCESPVWAEDEQFRNCTWQTVQWSKCKGSRPSQRFVTADLCDKVYNCIDRSDELECATGDATDNSIAIHLTMNKALQNRFLFPVELPRERPADFATTGGLYKECNDTEGQFGIEIAGQCFRPDELCNGNLDQKNDFYNWGRGTLHQNTTLVDNTPGTKIQLRFHPQHISICKNFTFWKNMWQSKTTYKSTAAAPQSTSSEESLPFEYPQKNITTDHGSRTRLTYCRGNTPGFSNKIYLTVLPNTCRDKRSFKNYPHGECPDNAHGTYCSEFNDRNSGKVNCSKFGLSAFNCDDENEKQCIPIELLCDGYTQCKDGSDEKDDICKTCPPNARGVSNGGYPPWYNRLSATLPCKHRYTDRWICSVP